jgi:hypothetical protein
MNKTTRQLLLELLEYASRQDHLPVYQAISRLIEYLDQSELNEQDIPLTRLSAQIDNFQQNKINKNDVLLDFLWAIESFGYAVRNLNLSQKIEELSAELKKGNKEFKKNFDIDIIDLKEIPPANTGAGDQDTFELFARGFLQALGYFIEDGPNRGADGGKDLIIIEPLSGIINDARRRWLVSCKHFAHSGKAVGVDIEKDINDRLQQFDCDGFMAFYSTLPSSGLGNKFSSIASKGISVEVLDSGKIAQYLISDERLHNVVAQYFPESYKRKRKREIEYKYQQQLLIIEFGQKSKIEEAARRLDAINVHKARREYSRKLDLAEKERNLELSQLDS